MYGLKDVELYPSSADTRLPFLEVKLQRVIFHSLLSSHCHTRVWQNITDDGFLGGSGVLVSFSVSKSLKCPLLVQDISSSGYHVPASGILKIFLFLYLQELARLYTVNFCKTKRENLKDQDIDCLNTQGKKDASLYISCHPWNV